MYKLVHCLVYRACPMTIAQVRSACAASGPLHSCTDSSSCLGYYGICCLNLPDHTILSVHRQVQYTLGNKSQTDSALLLPGHGPLPDVVNSQGPERLLTPDIRAPISELRYRSEKALGPSLSTTSGWGSEQCQQQCVQLGFLQGNHQATRQNSCTTKRKSKAQPQLASSMGSGPSSLQPLSSLLLKWPQPHAGRPERLRI